MTDEPTAAPGAGAARGGAFAEPVRPVSRVWVLWLWLISVGIWSGFFGPIQVLLAEQVAVLAPDSKETTLAIVTGTGAAVSTVLNPLWGAFSDRTVLRMGRRLPWVIGGLVAAVVAMVVLSSARSVPAVVLGWCLAQAALNAMLAAVTATVPDQVPTSQRGGVGGWLAIAQTLGVVTGSGIAAGTGSITVGYLVTAGVLVVVSLPYCLDSRDIALPRALREPFQLGRFVRSFWISPRRHPDFAWAWGTRFLMNFGNAILLLYLLYFARDVLGLGGRAAADIVFVMTALYAVVTILVAVVAGVWSDRKERRKPFVIGSGFITAAALVLLAGTTTVQMAIVSTTILAVGFGAYSAVDFAMITQVLPSADDRAKDLGVINIANALPQVLAPPVAAGVLALGLGFRGLYLLAAGVSVLGSWLVVNIRSLR